MQHCTLFQSYVPGDKFIAFDIPFQLAMLGNGKLKQDSLDPPGIRVHYCLKYSPGGEDGIRIHNTGLVWCQHMSHQTHPFHVATLANICKTKLAAFATQVTQMNQGHATHPPSSSPTHSSMQSLQPSSSSSSTIALTKH